jgi:hypothetical protein
MTKLFHVLESKSEIIENEIDHEKFLLQKLEYQALIAKFDNKVQYQESEAETLRSKLRKVIKVNWPYTSCF